MIMKSKNRRIGGVWPLPLTGFALLALATIAQGQTFTFTNNDLTLGFRKNNPYTENYEVVVDIGQASSYFNLSVGTTIPVPGYTPSQLSPGSFASLNNLSWSVFGSYSGSGYAGYVNDTLWLTVPRANNAVRSADATRRSYGVQQSVNAQMASIIGDGRARYISGQLGAGSFNTASFVRESRAAYANNILSVWMGGIFNAGLGTLHDTWPASEPNGGNLEATTPGSFATGTVRSDLYEVRPLKTATGVAVVDPHTGSSGNAWYIGYFELKPDGTMTFTREATSTAPVQVTLSIARTNNVSTILFATANSVTYTLFFTNAAGITAPFSTWPSLPGTFTGDGTTKSFQDSTTDPVRFYHVREQ
jgi:hypothetical protein